MRLQPELIHIEAAVYLDLQRMQAPRRPAVMLGDEAARIRLVAADGIAEPLQGVGGAIGELRHAARAKPVAEHEIRPDACRAAADVRGHRMAVDQDGEPEADMRLSEEPTQRVMEGAVDALDSRQA